MQPQRCSGAECSTPPTCCHSWTSLQLLVLSSPRSLPKAMQWSLDHNDGHSPLHWHLWNPRVSPRAFHSSKHYCSPSINTEHYSGAVILTQICILASCAKIDKRIMSDISILTIMIIYMAMCWMPRSNARGPSVPCS